MDGAQEGKRTRTGPAQAVREGRRLSSSEQLEATSKLLAGETLDRGGDDDGKQDTRVRGRGPARGDTGEDQEAGAGEKGKDQAGGDLEGEQGEAGKGKDAGELELDLADEDGAIDADKLADALGVERKDLYNLKVGIGNGESATLGELKDAFKQTKQIQLERDEWDTHREDAHAELIEAQRHIVETLALIPPEKIPPALRQLQANQRASYIQKERTLLYNAMPEWRDPAARMRDQEAIGVLVGRYGISSAELGATVDHRHWRILKDFQVLKSAAESARAKRIADAQAGRNDSGGRTLGKQQQAQRINREQGEALSRADRLKAVGRLIHRGG